MTTTTPTTYDDAPDLSFFKLVGVLVIVAMPVVSQTAAQIAFAIGLALCVAIVLRIGRDIRSVTVALALGIEALLFLGSAIR